MNIHLSLLESPSCVSSARKEADVAPGGVVENACVEASRTAARDVELGANRNGSPHVGTSMGLRAVPLSLDPSSVSTVSLDGAVARWRELTRGEIEASVETGFRFAAVQVGYWLGWASILVVLAGLALDGGARHRWLLVGSTLAAAAANTAAMLVPWRKWLSEWRGRLVLDAWCASLIAFVALLVTDAGSTFTLLLFLVVPFIAVVQAGWRRGFWLAATTATCTVVAALLPLSAGATVIRLLLVAIATAVALLLVRAIRVQSAARRRALARATLERTLAKEANHRIKNDLQAAADLLLLARPDGEDGEAFDETAARIRSIAAVHRLLTEAEDQIDGAALLRSIAASAPAPVQIEAEPVAFDAATAQKVGIVANELVMNAFRHGAPPIRMRLRGGRETQLRVEDAGPGTEVSAGLGLSLVRRMVEQGLGGRFELRSAVMGRGTWADVIFPARSR
jgi:two-component sensor histidine kinase